jgi:hypothetical protein
MSKRERLAHMADASNTPTVSAHDLSRRTWLSVAVGGAATVLLGKRLSARPVGAVPGNDPVITVYASPSCQCCHRWAALLESNAFDVTVEKVADVTPFKKKFGVPEKLWSCHTAVIGRYSFEGHVPVDLIEKVLIERPAIAGLAVPGMPKGSPGMESAVADKYDVIAFKANGETSVYAKR